jgi:hypothetical protein
VNLETTINLEEAQTFSHRGMLDLVNGVHELKTGIADAYSIVE